MTAPRSAPISKRYQKNTITIIERCYNETTVSADREPAKRRNSVRPAGQPSTNGRHRDGTDAAAVIPMTNGEQPVAGLASRNQLNDLVGREWIAETKSFWFQKGLGAGHDHAQIERQHPAPY